MKITQEIMRDFMKKLERDCEFKLIKDGKEYVFYDAWDNLWTCDILVNGKLVEDKFYDTFALMLRDIEENF